MACDLDVNAGNALDVLGFKFFGNAQHRGKKANLAAPGSFECRVRSVFELGLGFTVVVTHERGHHVAPPAAEARNIRIADKIFPVAMMRLPVNKMADVVEQRGDFQDQAKVRPQFMDGTELVEKRKRKTG